MCYVAATLTWLFFLKIDLFLPTHSVFVYIPPFSSPSLPITETFFFSYSWYFFLSIFSMSSALNWGFLYKYGGLLNVFLQA